MSGPKHKRAYVYVYTAQTRSPNVKKQVLACRAVAGAHELVIVKTEIDGGRCGLNEAGRDGRARLLEAAEAGKFDTLIIQNCDRLSRNLRDAASVMAQLAAYGIEILTVDNGMVSGLGIPTGFAESAELADVSSHDLGDAGADQCLRTSARAAFERNPVIVGVRSAIYGSQASGDTMATCTDQVGPRVVDGDAQPQPNLVRCAIYVRCASSSQHTPYPLADQWGACETYAARQGWQTVVVYKDPAISGLKTSRFSLDALMAQARQGAFEMVLVENVARLSRHALHLQSLLMELKRLGVGVHTVAGPLDLGFVPQEAAF
ncbi:hypothetical protein D3C71_699140 [compost metagenome]|jgi:DNA invertase Pin-like site-specific DNA recombinase